MNSKDSLKKLKVAIVTHVYATGPAHALEEYLKEKVNSLIFIQHPFPFCQDRRSTYVEYRHGNLVCNKQSPNFSLPGLLSYFKDMIYNFFWLSFRKYDLYIGVNNLNAFFGLILKKVARARKVIFYTIDYIPERFKNRLLNRIYHFIDSYCVKKSDYIWNLSPVMIEEREKKGIPKKYRKKQITVPVGTDLNVKKVPFDANKKCRITFMGHLREGQGVELLIESLPRLIEKIPEIKLILIGGGPLEDQLKERAKELGLIDHVEFTGFIKEHSKVQDRLSECSIGIAPYVDSAETYTRYTDPGKPKTYMALGLPVVITRVPQVAWEIAKRGAGLAINYDRKELIEAIKKLLGDSTLYQKCRKAAIQFAQESNWEKIFNQALQKIFSGNL